jgi:hypothetical protein
MPWVDMWVAYPVTADPLLRDLIRALQEKWGLTLSMEYDYTRRETAFRFRLRPSRAPTPRPRFWCDVQYTSSTEYLQSDKWKVSIGLNNPV